MPPPSVYSDGVAGYAAPPDIYGAPAATKNGYKAPSHFCLFPAPFPNSNPTTGGYNDPSAELLPEYYKSEHSLGLSDPADVPRVDPFSSDYRPSYLELSYGVPSAPIISHPGYKGWGGR